MPSRSPSYRSQSRGRSPTRSRTPASQEQSRPRSTSPRRSVSPRSDARSRSISRSPTPRGGRDDRRNGRTTTTRSPSRSVSRSRSYSRDKDSKRGRSYSYSRSPSRGTRSPPPKSSKVRVESARVPLGWLATPKSCLEELVTNHIGTTDRRREAHQERQRRPPARDLRRVRPHRRAGHACKPAM